MPAAVRHLGGERQRLAAGAGAKVDDDHARRRRAGEADELAALVLDLDQAAPPGRGLLDAKAFGQAEADRRPAASAPRRAARRAPPRACPSSRLTRRSSGARPSKAGHSSGAISRIEPLDAARRARSRPRRRGSPARDRRRRRAASRRSGLEQLRLGRGRAPSIAARPEAGRSPARRMAPIDELAHRAPVLRAGIAALREIAGDQRVRGRPAARARRR